MKDKRITGIRTAGKMPLSSVIVLQKMSLWVSAALVVVALWSAGKPADDIAPIAFVSEPLPFKPKEFFIANVIDERKDRNAVAYLLPLQRSAAEQPVKAMPVDLQGGGLSAVRQFMQNNAPANSKLRPVIIRLKEYQLQEKPGTKTGRVDGQVKVAMSFEYERDGVTVPLIEYQGGARYDRPASQHGVIEPTLRRTLADALQYLNTWMDREANRNEKLAKGLKVTFTDHVINLEDDSVFYTKDRPLNWNDFKGSPTKPSKFAASVFPSFAYEGQPEVIDGVIHLNLVMKVYVLKESSWAKADAKNAYGLNHEQKHFDIVKLVAERFKKKLHPGRLTLEDYNSIIQYEYIESFREMNRLQEQYDGETRHGLDQAAQASWNRRIENELRELGVIE
ncbi:hypothetical protein ACFS7Z_20150 [Pontibacter toksunensis]|uniref:DUF922 domain-containing protein n=1 Tax=Pontibacter toksunensis TaxID=1332631 RepID=A0ABW6C0A6_9BACT